MRYPGKSKSERRRDILKKARKLILKKGHENVSLRSIAKDAGYSPASLYEYFDGKDDILQEICSDILSELADSLRNAVGGGDDLLAIGTAYMQFAQTHPKDYLLVFFYTPSQRRHFGQDASGAYNVLLQSIIDVAGEQKWKKNKQLDAEAMAYGLWSLLHGQVMLQLTHLKDFDADFQAADKTLLKQFIKGLSAG